MNQDKKKEIIQRSIPDLENLYKLAWHQGRHEEREMLSTCGYLIIDPTKKAELESFIKDDPCKFCEHYNPEYRIGCTMNPKECKALNKQKLAIELTTYFK